MERCKAYRRASGVIVYRGVRCVLWAGHVGCHAAPGRWLDPTAAHYWGRDRWPHEAEIQAGMPGQVRGLEPPR